MKLTEITRSYNRKINLGNYETADFFCSQKLEVPLEEAEKTSEELFKFCKEEVMKSVNEYRNNQLDKISQDRKAKQQLDFRTEGMNSGEDEFEDKPF